MVSSIGQHTTALTPQPQRRGQGAEGFPANRQGGPDSNPPGAPTTTRQQDNANASRQTGDQPKSRPNPPALIHKARQAIDERTGKASELQVFRADQVPLKSVQALQTYGSVAAQGQSGQAGASLAGLSIHV